MLSKYCWGWCGCKGVYLVLDNNQNLQFGSPVPRITRMEVVGCVPPSRLRQFSKTHLLLPTTLHAVLYFFGDCAHHPARFITTQLSELCIFFVIFLVFPILLIVRSGKIAKTVSDSIQHLFESRYRLSSCPPRAFSSSYIFHLLHNHCLRVWNSLSCHSAFPFHIILDSFLFLFVA